MEVNAKVMVEKLLLSSLKNERILKPMFCKHINHFINRKTWFFLLETIVKIYPIWIGVKKTILDKSILTCQL